MTIWSSSIVTETGRAEVYDTVYALLEGSLERTARRLGAATCGAAAATFGCRRRRRGLSRFLGSMCDALRFLGFQPGLLGRFELGRD